MNETTSIVKKFFGVVAQEETYLNLIYLLLAFPLGTVYFTFLVTGLSLGIGLLIVWIGVALIVLDCGLLYFAARLFQREAILTRWK